MLRYGFLDDTLEVGIGRALLRNSFAETTFRGSYTYGSTLVEGCGWVARFLDYKLGKFG